MFAVIARFTNRSCLFPSVIQSYFSPLAGSPNKCFLLHKTSSSGTRHVIWSQGKLETVDQGQQWQNRLSSPNHRTTRPSTHFATTPFSLIFFSPRSGRIFFFILLYIDPPPLHAHDVLLITRSQDRSIFWSLGSHTYSYPLQLSSQLPPP